MKRTLALFVILLAGITLGTAEEVKTKRAKLTAKEAAEGWILLFDGESTFGWTSPDGSKWTVVDGLLTSEGDKPSLLVTTSIFHHCEIDVECKTRMDNPIKLCFGCDKDGSTDSIHGYYEFKSIRGGWMTAALSLSEGGLGLDNASETNSDGSKGSISANLGGSLKKGVGPGHLAFMGTGIVIRRIKLRPLGGKDLFNGKDLKGWKEHPGKKSTFSVSSTGELHIKEGPGDLQTEAQWSDFLLQLDCRTNGKHLNSGVFFRCLPGEYQQGYEAQIHNGFLQDANKEYTIDIYDPKTHELTEKKKIKSTAIDYGTGAIYRRIPARWSVAEDNKWFTMTVAANGRHLATWVDGVQVVDWTDDRPLKNNARQGCRLEAGPISLQGHDPTTDLDFRSIRMIDLKAKPKDKDKPGTR